MKTPILVLGVIFLSLSCFSQEKIYISFENNVDGMFLNRENEKDSSFYYTIKMGKSFWYGFRAIENEKIVNKKYFEQKIKKDLKRID